MGKRRTKHTSVRKRIRHTLGWILMYSPFIALVIFLLIEHFWITLPAILFAIIVVFIVIYGMYLAER